MRRNELHEVRIVTQKRSHFRTPRTIDECEFDNERSTLRPIDRADRIVLKGCAFVAGVLGVLFLLGRL
jgi:hypothetical protein